MRKLLAFVVTCAALGGCAVVPTGGPQTAGQKADPFESVNRKVFGFNDTVDKAVLEPIARGYRRVVPQFVRTGIGNVLGNINDAWSTVNHLLQGKGVDGAHMGMRVITNSVFGFAGLLDPASEMGLTRHSEDFGQTLGRWGVGPGPYVVLPLLGPSTVRDASAFVLDRQAAPAAIPKHGTDQIMIAGVELVHTRAGLLATGDLVNQVALDRYSFVRDGYLARRLDQVYDGSPPLEKFDDEPADTPPAAVPAAAASAPAPSRPASAPRK